MPHYTEAREEKEKPNPRCVVGIAVFFVLIAFISMILSIASYSEWKSNADDFKDVIANWQENPILNVTAQTPCPDGWENSVGGSFTVENHKCVCSEDATYGNTIFSSRYCDEIANTVNCTDAWVFDQTISFSEWQGGENLCFLRGGPSAVDRKESCSSSEKVCLTNSKIGGDFCWPNDQPCPVMSISATETPNVNGNWETVDIGNGEVLYISRTIDDGRPLLQFATGEGQPCKNGGFDSPGRTWDSTFGAGYLEGLDSTLTLTQFYAATGEPYFRTDHQEGGCSTDNRYEQYEEDDEQNLLDQNGYGSTNAYASDSGSATWKIYNRPEIQWDSDCEYSRSDVANLEDEIDEITAGALALMIITIFATIFDAVTTYLVVKVQLDDDAYNDDAAAAWQKIGKVVFILGSMVTSIIVLIVAASVTNFFNSIKECSDPQTNQTLENISDEVNEIARIWYAKIALDALLTLYSVAYAWYYRRSMFSYGLVCCTNK